MEIQAAEDWCAPAPASQRANWARQLGSAYLGETTDHGDRNDIEALLFAIAGDPASCVRRALAETLAHAPNAPSRVVARLAHDVDSVAGPVLQASPLLGETDLAAIAATASHGRRAAILARPTLPASLCAALSAGLERDVVRALLVHRGACLDRARFAAFATAFADDAEIRGLMIDRVDLPAELRLDLMRAAGEAIASSPLAHTVLGTERSARISAEACERGTADLLGETRSDDLSGLIGRLLDRDRLSAAILLRLACSGALEGLTEALAQLSGVQGRKIRAVLVEGRRSAFETICERAGLPSAATSILFAAVGIWREADERAEFPTSGEVAARLITRMAAEFGARRAGDLDTAIAFLGGLAREMAIHGASGSKAVAA